MVTKSILSDGRKERRDEGFRYREPMMEREKKKVEWKKNLSTVESFSPSLQDRSPNWDSETGNMLSYFLGDAVSGNEHFVSEIPTISKSEYEVPPTPATKYYYNSESKPRPSNTQRATSNNPLIKMKVPSAADRLNAGDTSLQQIDVLSPISPTSMLGPGQEPLMLPPSPNDQNEAYKNNTNWLEIKTILNPAQHVVPRMPESQSITSIPPPPGLRMPQPLHYSNVTPNQPVSLQRLVNPVLFTHAALIQQHVSSAGECDEKRARRLERNRESARRSRRNKKERLSTLGEKVSNLYEQIELERRKKINSIDDAFEDDLKDNVTAIKTIVEHTKQQEQKEKLANFLQSAGLNSPVRRAVLDFQYTTLKQAILPPYHKLILWLTLHPEKFFTGAKEYHFSNDVKKLGQSPGKLSSKQVGDELMACRKPAGETAKSSPEKGERDNQTAQALDEARMWPLLCFELSVSVEQEVKITSTLKRVKQLQYIQERRCQMATATKMAINLKEAVMYQSHATSVRSRKALTEILTPQQTIRYKEWLGSNRDRCKENFATPMKQSASSPPQFDKTSLLDICKKLEKIVISQERSCSDKVSFSI